MRPRPISPSPRRKCFERSRSSDNSSGGRTSDIWHVQAGRSLKQPKRRYQKNAVPLIFFLQNCEKRYCHSSRGVYCAFCQLDWPPESCSPSDRAGFSLSFGGPLQSFFSRDQTSLILDEQPVKQTDRFMHLTTANHPGGAKGRCRQSKTWDLRSTKCFGALPHL